MMKRKSRVLLEHVSCPRIDAMQPTVSDYNRHPSKTDINAAPKAVRYRE